MGNNQNKNQNKKGITRRNFLQSLGVGTLVFTVTPVISFVNKAYAYEITRKKYDNFFKSPIGQARMPLIKARQDSQYLDDRIVREKFDLASSAENPMIRTFYSKFSPHPLSEISEKLLHTHYIARKRELEEIA